MVEVASNIEVSLTFRVFLSHSRSWEHGRVLADLIGAPSSDNDGDHRHLIGGSFPTSGTDDASPDRRIRVGGLGLLRICLSYGRNRRDTSFF